MKIYPRLVEVAHGAEECVFYIKNTSVDRLLLFKIRRSEPKLIEFSPKCGIVEPGVTQHITMKLANPNVTHARLLVKLVAIHRTSLCAENFEGSWSQGEDKMVKKVVDVYNRAFEIDAADEVSVDSDTNSNSDGEVADATHDDEGVVYTPAIVRPSTDKSIVTTAMSDAACIDSSNDASLQDDAHEIHSSVSSPVAVPKRRVRSTNSTMTADSINPDDSLLQSIFKLLPNRSSSQEESEKSLLIGVGLGLGAAMTNNNSHILADTAVLRSVGVSKPTASVISLQPALINRRNNVISSSDVPMELLPDTIHASTSYHYIKGVDISQLSSSNILSSYVTLPSSIINSDSKVLIQVSDNTSDANQLKAIIEESMLNLAGNKKRVAALNLVNTSIGSIERVLGQIFSGDESPDNTLISLLLEDNMEYIGVTNTNLLKKLDSASLSRFNRLVALDLSSNSIASITSTLVIPSLQYLDLSNNNLKTLDYLQQLISLRHLNVSNNKLATLAASMYMLVPLSHNLTSFDMRHNPVCVSYKAQYVGETLRILHRLAHFDGVAINNYRNNVKNRVESEFEMRLKRELKHRELHKVAAVTVASDMDHLNISTSQRSVSSTPTRRGRSETARIAPSTHRPVPPPSTAKKNTSLPVDTSIQPPSTTKKVASASASLLRTTNLYRQRRKSFGISSIANNADINDAVKFVNTLEDLEGRLDKSVDTTTGSHAPTQHEISMSSPNKYMNQSSRYSKEIFDEMQEDPRFGIWHARYRIPKPTFGFSKPFAHRPPPPAAKNIPLFDKFVNRLREGFERLPARGTFNRESKNFKPFYYPMDWDEAEALRRRGFFDDIDMNRFHRSDDRLLLPKRSKSTSPGNVSRNRHRPEPVTSPVSVMNSAKKGRRPSIGPHHGRGYLDDCTTPDEFSSYRKWHPELFQDNIDHITSKYVSGSTGSRRNSIASRTSNDSDIQSRSINDSNTNATHLFSSMNDNNNNDVDANGDTSKMDKYMEWLARTANASK